MPKREFADMAELTALAGQEVGVSDWMEITRQRIDAFAAATEDYQWIHVDVERSKRESPFGTTIAHGFLTLSLIPHLSHEVIGIRQKFAMAINYGLNRVRFVSPVRCGARVRSRHRLLEVTGIQGGWQTRWQVTIEIEGQQKPACVAETIGRLYTEGPKPS
ncbi:MAG: MaoC family dehydratase [Acidobacteria bacterium]|nr:MaoC family dehydratase [Acidobacteriota bacterium]